MTAGDPASDSVDPTHQDMCVRREIFPQGKNAIGGLTFGLCFYSPPKPI